MTVLAAFLKFYNNLTAIDIIRNLAAKLFTIMIDIKAFWFIVAVTLMCFSNIFYVGKVWSKSSSGNIRYDHYLLWTYDVFFGNWETINPEEEVLIWLKAVFVLFTILFPILVMNILIALITDSYSNAQINEKCDDSRQKLDLIIEIIESRLYILKCCRKRLKIEDTDFAVGLGDI